MCAHPPTLGSLRFELRACAAADSLGTGLLCDGTQAQSPNHQAVPSRLQLCFPLISHWLRPVVSDIVAAEGAKVVVFRLCFCEGFLRFLLTAMPSYRFLDFELSEGEFCLIRGGQRIALEPKALRVLTLLVRRAGHLVDKRELLESVWPNSFVEENTLTRTITILRRELGDSSRDSKIIETVPTRGYRFIAPVTALEEENRTATPNSEALTVPTNGQNIASEPDGPSQPPGLRLVDEQQDQTAGKVPVAEIVRGQRNWHARKWLLVGAVSLLVLVAVTTYILTRSRPADAKAPKITSLAVLPLKNLSGDPAQEYFADGMTEEVIGRLSMIRGLRVISRTSVMQFKDTHLSAPEIARKLGVDALVEGSVIRDGNRIRVHAQLIRASTDEHFWSESYDRELGDALTLESDVAQSIAQRWRLLSPAKSAPGLSPPVRFRRKYMRAISRVWPPKATAGMKSKNRLPGLTKRSGRIRHSRRPTSAWPAPTRASAQFLSALPRLKRVQR